MSKLLRLQVLMDVRQYNSLENYCTEHNIKYRNVSDMMRRILSHSTNLAEKCSLDVYRLQGLLDDLKKENKRLELSNQKLNLDYAELSKEYNIFKNNLENKKSKTSRKGKK